jgi:hypothetical protein
MKTLILLIGYVPLGVFTVCAQGVFIFSNITAPTRIGASDGALAGPGFWAQMLAGTNAAFLQPIGAPTEHFPSGKVNGGYISVPGVPAYNVPYVQMVAWDGNLWGTSLAGVPADQLGRTDIVTVLLTTGVFPDPTYAPPFTQPAIVPIPEPSVSALLGFAACLAFVSRFARRQLRHPKSKSMRHFASTIGLNETKLTLGT